MFFLFLKTFSLILDFAVILCNTFPCTKKFLFHSYAAIFRRFCPFCIYDANVRNFHLTSYLEIFKYSSIQVGQEGFRISTN